MAIVEIDEREFLAHKTVTESVNKLLANPKTRRKLLELQKEVNPDASIPEIDAAAGVREEMEQIRKQNADLLAEMRAERDARAAAESEAKGRRSIEAGRDKLRQRGFTDEGIGAVEKLMMDTGTADYELAADAFERRQPPPEPIRGGGGTAFGMFDPDVRGSDELKAMMSNPDDSTALNKIVNDTLRAARGR